MAGSCEKLSVVGFGVPGSDEEAARAPSRAVVGS